MLEPCLGQSRLAVRFSEALKSTCSSEIWVPGLATFELYGGIPKQTTLVGLMGSESSEETWLQTILLQQENPGSEGSAMMSGAGRAVGSSW